MGHCSVSEGRGTFVNRAWYETKIELRIEGRVKDSHNPSISRFKVVNTMVDGVGTPKPSKGKLCVSRKFVLELKGIQED